MFNSGLISQASPNVWKVDPTATVEKPAVLPARSEKPHRSPPLPRQRGFSVIKPHITTMPACVAPWPQRTRCPYQSRAAPPWFLSGRCSLFLSAENELRAARWTTRESPNHTRCCAAEDVASACAIEHQDGVGEKTQYSAALGKIGRHFKQSCSLGTIISAAASARLHVFISTAADRFSCLGFFTKKCVTLAALVVVVVMGGGEVHSLERNVIHELLRNEGVSLTCSLHGTTNITISLFYLS